ncbi:type II secretion system protein GspC [Klebsiella pneumoniae]|uniref:type II secretion system protein GspC n=1 Tax=Klebsiella pneumoniae TaxID=573 RepID=UPI000E2C0FAC|nr:type II secretion system protein GspC [Klebsiella pneumoniae]HBQ5910221.1 type II secretion system protein GspC [Klebsiella pneumoniae subsp. pneumoniae]MBG1253673.1 type II secretion system protein GspC [Klebsiella pneumoniae]MBZ1665707.1 type II secretion system protein GspC [Klebsiella pneumoniae]MCJ8579151.1 type II secretion system protein GspC [Klebsiella pneumoniae]MCM6248585.1 type II secretion system protein GspC [Klebsiella pneumoniae]
MPVSVMRLTNINKGIMKLLPQIVTLIILITAIPQLAKLTWRVVFPVSPEDISALPLTMPPAADPELKNVRPAFTLFGLAVKNSPTPTDAASLNQVPVSSLKLRLAGLLASSNPARSIAIIEKGNQQVSLSTGDPLPGYDARIAAILPDRIIVNYQGRKEAILLFNDSRAPSPPPTAAGNPPLVKRLREQPQNILTYLSISPVLSGDKLLGYRLNPGKDASLFRQSGLQANDLAIALNGIDLRDQEQAQQALQNLADMTEITLTVEREGQRHDIAFALGDE